MSSELTSTFEIQELTVEPDRYTPVRYAGASGDFNPIHVDDEFARKVGLPGRILHGLWSMSQVARAQSEAIAAAGEDPAKCLVELSVEFRGMAVPDQPIVVTSEITDRDLQADQITVKPVAKQGSTRIIRNAEAKIKLG